MLTNGEEDGFEDIDVRLKHYNMTLNVAVCDNGTSQNKDMRIGKDNEMNGKWTKYKRN